MIMLVVTDCTSQAGDNRLAVEAGNKHMTKTSMYNYIYRLSTMIVSFRRKPELAQVTMVSLSDSCTFSMPPIDVSVVFPTKLTSVYVKRPSILVVFTISGN